MATCFVCGRPATAHLVPDDPKAGPVPVCQVDGFRIMELRLTGVALNGGTRP